MYSAVLCFALDLDDQERTGFRYDYSFFQAIQELPCDNLGRIAYAKSKLISHNMSYSAIGKG